MIKVGDYIKANGRQFGRVTHVYEPGAHNPERMIGYVTHNGMKPRHNGAAESKCEKITKERFVAWIKRAGCTSMYQYVE